MLVGFNTQPCGVSEYWPGPQAGNLLSVQWSRDSAQAHPLNMSSSEADSMTPMTQIPNIEVLTLFADCLGVSVGSNICEYREQILSQLDELTIESHEDELAGNVKKLIESSKMQSALQLLRYSVYLSTNNLLSDSKTDKLIE